FWSSLFHRFGLTGNVFRYFDYDEVFERVVDSSPDDRLRLCVERTPDRKPRLLAVSNPKRGLLGFDDSAELVQQNQGQRLRYHDGTLTSEHTPHSGNFGFDIGGDTFHNRFVCEIPVDGFGQPRIYLSLLRQVCDNGMVGYSRAFRSDIRVGNDAHHTLARALGQFDSDEGFAAIRQRFESAQRSWASVREVLQLRQTLTRCRRVGDELTSPFIHALDKTAGDLHGLYGVANLDNLSVKRQRILPARCRVYDLLNLASEIATHQTDAKGTLALNAYIGTLVSEEYDLEGTAEKVPDFQDLFLDRN
ncbi:MAG: DUF932 domain-containing protein, partial [Planctomycetota bacterium]